MIEPDATLNAIKQAANELTLILGGTQVVLVALIAWLGKIWAERILENDRRKNRVFLEELQNSLLNDRERTNQTLTTQLDQSRFLFEKTISRLSENQKLISEKRLTAIETLWKSIIELRELTAGNVLIDLIREHEQELFRTTKVLNEQIKNISLPDLTKNFLKITSELQANRIYIPEIIWQFYNSYKTILLTPQIQLKIVLESKSTKPLVPWYKEESFRIIIEAVLDDDEVKEFDSLSINQISWMQGRIEAKILALVREYLDNESGLDSSTKTTLILGEANHRVEETVMLLEHNLSHSA